MLHCVSDRVAGSRHASQRKGLSRWCTNSTPFAFRSFNTHRFSLSFSIQFDHMSQRTNLTFVYHLNRISPGWPVARLLGIYNRIRALEIDLATVTVVGREGRWAALSSNLFALHEAVFDDFHSNSATSVSALVWCLRFLCGKMVLLQQLSHD